MNSVERGCVVDQPQPLAKSLAEKLGGSLVYFMANRFGLTFSKTFGLKLDGSEEWFDPCVWLDSPLCVDPFLMLDLEIDDEFKRAHDEIVGFFQRQINRVAAGGTNMDSPAIKAVRQALHMPEASEFYLGYPK